MKRSNLGRTQIITGLLREYHNFADLLSRLEVSMWTTPTRCVDWQVCDVAAHVVAQAGDAVSGRIGTRSPDEQAAAMRHQPPGALAAELRDVRESTARLAEKLDDDIWMGPSTLTRFTVGDGFHALLNDAYVHGDDIRDALGLPFDEGPGLTESLDFVLSELSRDPVASVHPRVQPLIELPADCFTERSGIDAHDFLLVANGRLDARAYRLPDDVNIFRQRQTGPVEAQ
jgi:uncharacterized protein (TIGR03083 family)